MKEIENFLSKQRRKSVNDLSLNELSVLKYIIGKFPKDMNVSINVNDKEYKNIGDYIFERQNSFFDVENDAYNNIVGKCFIDSDKTTVVKVVGLKDDYDNPYYRISEFLYEKYEQYHDGSWHCQDYIWLQETAKSQNCVYDNRANEQYLKWCYTSQTEMNINAEGMFMLGKDGNLYVDVSCGGDYIIYTPMNNATFELIKDEALANDGEYQVGQ